MEQANGYGSCDDLPVGERPESDPAKENRYFVFYDLAAGKFSEVGLAQWLEVNPEPAPK